jgi:hypothetical protein
MTTWEKMSKMFEDHDPNYLIGTPEWNLNKEVIFVQARSHGRTWALQTAKLMWEKWQEEKAAKERRWVRWILFGESHPVNWNFMKDLDKALNKNNMHTYFGPRITTELPKIKFECETMLAIEKELASIPEEHRRPRASVHEGYALILEELDELWDEAKKKDPSKDKMRAEAVQIAAMAVRFIQELTEKSASELKAEYEEQTLQRARDRCQEAYNRLEREKNYVREMKDLVRWYRLAHDCQETHEYYHRSVTAIRSRYGL